MEITDIIITPDDGSFQVGLTQFPTKMKFWIRWRWRLPFPTAEKPYEAELQIIYNNKNESPGSVTLKGVGISNIVCESCEPPPPPECALEGNSSIHYEVTASDSCESEAGVCAYLMFETLCTDGTCEVATGLCANSEPRDPCVDIDCGDNGNCENREGEAVCVCEEGYGLSEVTNTCEDMDECELQTDNCDINATCDNTEGSFSCTCNTGYNGDGTSCADINECILDMQPCDANATCDNTEGGYTCTCNSGFTGTGDYADDTATCTDVDECALETDNCDPNATCENTTGAFICACNMGYFGDGATCDDIDECVFRSR